MQAGIMRSIRTWEESNGTIYQGAARIGPCAQVKQVPYFASISKME